MDDNTGKCFPNRVYQPWGRLEQFRGDGRILGCSRGINSCWLISREALSRLSVVFWKGAVGQISWGALLWGLSPSKVETASQLAEWASRPLGLFKGQTGPVLRTELVCQVLQLWHPQASSITHFISQPLTLHLPHCPPLLCPIILSLALNSVGCWLMRQKGRGGNKLESWKISGGREYVCVLAFLSSLFTIVFMFVFLCAVIQPLSPTPTQCTPSPLPCP